MRQNDLEALHDAITNLVGSNGVLFDWCLFVYEVKFVLVDDNFWSHSDTLGRSTVHISELSVT